MGASTASREWQDRQARNVCTPHLFAKAVWRDWWRRVQESLAVRDWLLDETRIKLVPKTGRRISWMRLR